MATPEKGLLKVFAQFFFSSTITASIFIVCDIYVLLYKKSMSVQEKFTNILKKKTL